MPLKPPEWPVKLQEWAFRAFKPRSLGGWGLLKDSKFKEILIGSRCLSVRATKVHDRPQSLALALPFIQLFHTFFQVRGRNQRVTSMGGSTDKDFNI